jgi:hypothetical protein
MFVVVVVNTKVVDNFIIFLVFKLHDHRPNTLGVMNLTNDHVWSMLCADSKDFII